jgi:hypothetical protein
MQAILDDAVAAYEATAFWDALESGYRHLAGDSAAWRAVADERRGEASALRDGVDGE